MLIKLFSALFLILSIAACSNKPVLTQSAQQALWSERQLQLNSINTWEIGGRLGVKTSEDAWSASLKWQHNQEHSRLRIIAPFHGTYEIKQQGKEYSLITPEDGMLVTQTPEQVMLENVGWSLPVNSLSHWVKGVPDESYKIQDAQLNEKSELIELQQKNWHIQFSNYKRVKHYSLPGKIILSNQYATITLLNKEWKLVQ